MTPRDRNIQILALLVALLALLGSGVLAPAITAEAGRAQLNYTDEAQEGDPPEVALGIAMGAFRGLFVNYLWIRANKLKEDGKFYEAIELSSAITRLQPRFPRVWAFHAWNMSYNISVATNTAAERWEWVQAGIKLLRDQAIPRNPNDVLLHKELAWIFVHKIQGWSDDANHYYKRELAREWTIVLGQPPLREGTAEQNTKVYADWLRKVVDAPDTFDELIRRELEERAAAGEPSLGAAPGTQPLTLVAELAERLRTEARAELGFDLLRSVEFYRAVKTSEAAKRFGAKVGGAVKNDSLEPLLDDAKYARAWELLLPYIRRKLLVETYHMQPVVMLRYTERFGPLDWRHPATHALYWASLGVEEGLQRQNVTDFDTLNTDRVVTHAMQELWRFGQLEYDLITNEYFALTDWNFVDGYENVLNEVRKRAGVADDPQRPFRLYSIGYENFLRDVVRACYNRGDYAMAEKYHSKLRNFSEITTNDPGRLYRYQLPLKEFVEEEMKERITIPYVAVTEIEGALIEAFTRGVMLRKPEVFKKEMEYAKAAHTAFLSEQGTRTLADPEYGRMKAYVGETFDITVRKVLVRLLTGGSVGAPGGGYNLGPAQSADLFTRLQPDFRQLIYDDLISQLTQRNPNLTPEYLASLFPEPAGMAEYRATRAAIEAASDKSRREGVQFEKQ